MQSNLLPSESKNPGRGARRPWSGVIRCGAGLLTAGLLATGVLTLGASAASAAGTYATTATVNVRNGAGTGSGVIRTEPNGAGFALDCQAQNSTNVNGNATWDYVHFGDGLTGWIADYYTTTPSFNSFAPGTGPCSAPVSSQMQNAVAWATAEKNSPDPTWSDHFGHAWSGYCEQFVEQAEGFAFRFPSAIADYQWEANHGRIHTDTNPPPGALVFYGGGGGYGHVAVSIGNGQEIGTLGYAGQRLPVRQYPVVGYLSNPYLGWANPIGS
jgi:uncharacterized protein YraI